MSLIKTIACLFASLLAFSTFPACQRAKESIGSCPADPLDVKIAAHRGASSESPENTLAAFKQGWAIGADFDELDVWLSRDKRVMVIHDADTTRVSGINYVVKDTDSSVLRTLDVGAYFGKKFVGERIPFIEEVLDIIPVGKGIFIDVKCGTDVIPYLKTALETHGVGREIYIISFSVDVLSTVKKEIPGVKTYLLQSQVNVDSANVFQTMKNNEIDGLDLSLDSTVSPGTISKQRRAGSLFALWTVDSESGFDQVSKINIDAVTTNDPVWVRNYLSSCANQ